jgi:outer membrane protein assembly factor BamA
MIFGGVSAAQFSDFSSLVDNFSASLLYLNLKHRLNYGVGAFRFKGRYRDVALDVYDEATWGGYFVASYPLTKFRRLEFQFGIEKSQRTDLEDAFEEGIFGRTTRPDPRDLTRDGVLSTNYVSFVKDNTLWLPTGPIDGDRYNFTAGLVSCFSCTTPSEITGEPVERSAVGESFVLYGDVRRYFRTSLQSAYAIRAFAFYSGGAIPGRWVLGGTNWLRGYPRWSLAGSRVWLVNQEWRFPLLDGLSLAFPFGTLRLPGVQGALFTDIGSSWLESQSKAEGSWGSYGISFRSSLGLPLVLRLDIGRRFRVGDPPPVVFPGRSQFNDTFFDFFLGFNY